MDRPVVMEHRVAKSIPRIGFRSRRWTGLR